MDHVERTELYAKDTEEVYQEAISGKISEEVKMLRLENLSIQWKFDLYVTAVIKICSESKCKQIKMRSQQFVTDGYNHIQNLHRQKRKKP